MKIRLTESEFNSVITTVAKRLIEDNREDIFKEYIKKQFPEALNSYHGEKPYSELYLDLVNNKKGEDKLAAKNLRIQQTADRNERIKAEKAKYRGEHPELFKNKSKNNHELLRDFVDFLPNTFPDIWRRNSEKNGPDSAFYFLIGFYIDKFQDSYGKDSADKIGKAVNSNKYEEYLFNLIDDRFGEHVIEW